MANKTYCDKCTEEITTGFREDSCIDGVDVDLCNDCIYITRIYLGTKQSKTEREAIETENERLAEIAQERADCD